VSRENYTPASPTGSWRRSCAALLSAGLALHALAVIALAQDSACLGDCNGDGDVTVDELIKGINIALGTVSPSACPAFADCLDVTCLISAVNNALNGCPVHAATPTVTQVTATPTATAAATATNTPTVTATATYTVTPSPTPTPTPVPGPAITFFGLADGSGHVLPSAGVDPQGIPIYAPLYGAGFIVVVEAKAGTSRAAPGVKTSNSNPSDPSARPDIQIEANHDLGNGSALVCDVGPAPQPLGGVPGIDPPSYDAASQMIADALNDFGCRLATHTSSDPCTLSDKDNPAFVASGTSSQACSAGILGRELEFPSGDTLLTVQWRDTASAPNLSRPSQLLVRVP